MKFMCQKHGNQDLVFVNPAAHLSMCCVCYNQLVTLAKVGREKKHGTVLTDIHYEYFSVEGEVL